MEICPSQGSNRERVDALVAGVDVDEGVTCF